LADISSIEGPISAEVEESRLLLDAVSIKIASRAKKRTDAIIRDFSFFCLLWKLINFCME
jgi:hypothetical protein